MISLLFMTNVGNGQMVDALKHLRQVLVENR